MNQNELKNNLADILYIEHEDHFAQYTALYGEERAQGYKDALLHILQDFDDFRHDRPVEIKSSLSLYLRKKNQLFEEINVSHKLHYSR